MGAWLHRGETVAPTSLAVILVLSLIVPTASAQPAQRDARFFDADPGVGPQADPNVVDLLGGQHLVSSALVYTGFVNGGTSAFPLLLSGANASTFWSSDQTILELAPSLTSGHSAGLVMFSSASFSNQTLSIVGVASSTYDSGDGLEAYLFMSPLHAVNWSIPYYATDPEGPNGTFESPQGSVLFPYSSTPYIAVQWDPAYGQLHSVYLYLVTPGEGGVVAPSNIVTFRVGSGSALVPSVPDLIALNVTVDVTTSKLVGTVVDENSGSTLSAFEMSLATAGFTPSYAVGANFFFGAGGSGNEPNAWGLLYLGLSGVTTPSSSNIPFDFLALGLVALAVTAVVAVVLLNRRR